MSTSDPIPTQDQQHLDLLGIFHYVVAGLGALFSLIPVVHLAMGLAMVTGHFPHKPDEPDPAMFGWIFVAVGGAFILFGLTFSALLAYAGRCLRQRRRHTFCLVMAAISCAFMPFGTVLGVFTLIVLTRASVKPLFTPA